MFILSLVFKNGKFELKTLNNTTSDDL